MASQQTTQDQNTTIGNDECPRSRREQRRASRANTSYTELLQPLRVNGFASNEEAERAAPAVLCTLGLRLNPDETWNLHSQQPSRLRGLLTSCEHYQWVKPRIPTHAIRRSDNIWSPILEEPITVGAERRAQGVVQAAARATNETRPPNKLAPPDSAPDSRRAPTLVEQPLELSIDTKLGILRTIAPRILAQLNDVEREGFLRERAR